MASVVVGLVKEDVEEMRRAIIFSHLSHKFIYALISFIDSASIYIVKYVCMYACMYVCMYVCKYVYMYVCMYAF